MPPLTRPDERQRLAHDCGDTAARCVLRFHGRPAPRAAAACPGR